MLTDAKIKALKPGPGPVKVSDSGGLHLLVTPGGSKLWRMAYRFAGKQRTLAFGIYPTVSLADARAHREAAKTQLRQKINPGAVVKAEKQAAAATTANTFAAVSTEWLQKKMIGERKAHRARTRFSQSQSCPRSPTDGLRPPPAFRSMFLLDTRW
jgi:Arm DNA-binding domain